MQVDKMNSIKIHYTYHHLECSAAFPTITNTTTIANSIAAASMSTATRSTTATIIN
jgi:hypothetical protein